jgi:hypothetical protein
MVTATQIKRGLGSFISREILPNIPGGTLKRVAIGTVLDLFLDNIEKSLTDTGSALYSMLGIGDGAGNVDISKLAEKIKANMTDDGMRIDLNVWGFKLGDMVLHKGDIDNLVRHIVNA